AVGPALREKPLACLRQRDGTFFAPRKELCAEHSLQGLNLVAERRRRDIELVGRTREVELLGHGHEIPEVPQCHCQMSVPKSATGTHSRMYRRTLQEPRVAVDSTILTDSRSKSALAERLFAPHPPPVKQR